MVKREKHSHWRSRMSVVEQNHRESVIWNAVQASSQMADYYYVLGQILWNWGTAREAATRC